MALVPCPLCGKEISEYAVSCPGCGEPIPHYALLVLDDREDWFVLLTYVSEWKGCTREEAEQWICAPCVLRRGMTWAEAQETALDLSGCTVQILPEEEADQLCQTALLRRTRKQEEKPHPLTFWETVKAVMLGGFLLWLILMLLGGLFFG